jgi:hypothetical protein
VVELSTDSTTGVAQNSEVVINVGKNGRYLPGLRPDGIGRLEAVSHPHSQRAALARALMRV